MTTYQALLPIAIEAVDRASHLLRNQSPGALTHKGDRDLASQLDYQIEREVRSFLRERTPHIGFHGEEEGPFGATEMQWALDPIDGTANFVRSLPMCGISLGLVHHENPVLGVIDLPFLTGRYSATIGNGAHLNGQPIMTSATNNITSAIVAIGDYAVGIDAAVKNRLRLALTAELAEIVQRVRMTGSAALDLAWLAEGKIDAALTLSNHLWDMAAGVAIAREAGASIIDIDGSAYTKHSSTTLATTPYLKDDIFTILKRVSGENITV
ncbi:inositol monophosphatase family protein [Micromonospora sp. NPDC003197]